MFVFTFHFRFCISNFCVSFCFRQINDDAINLLITLITGRNCWLSHSTDGVEIITNLINPISVESVNCTWLSMESDFRLHLSTHPCAREETKEGKVLKKKHSHQIRKWSQKDVTGKNKGQTVKLFLIIISQTSRLDESLWTYAMAWTPTATDEWMDFSCRVQSLIFSPIIFTSTAFPTVLSLCGLTAHLRRCLLRSTDEEEKYLRFFWNYENAREIRLLKSA